MTNEAITLGIVLEHIHAMRADLGGRMGRLEKRMNGLENRMDRLEGRMDGLEGRMDGLEGRMDGIQRQIEGIDGRLDIIEIAIVDQKHEKRIRRLEKHCGLAIRS